MRSRTSLDALSASPSSRSSEGVSEPSTKRLASSWARSDVGFMGPLTPVGGEQPRFHALLKSLPDPAEGALNRLSRSIERVRDLLE